MYHYIEGKHRDAPAGFAVIDAGGVGYLLMVSDRTAGELSRLAEGADVRLYTYLNVREDAMELFGFLHEDERRCFLLLISVSGVGPRAALAVLSTLSPEKLALSVLSDDAKTISAAPGVGLKTAQKIILELRDKFAKESVFASGGAFDAGKPATRSNLEEAINALVVLGYPRATVARACTELDAGRPVEEIVKALLQKLGGK